MKIIALIFSLIVCSIISYAQKTDSCNDYSKAKEIIADLDKIVAPTGVQESYEVSIGGIKQWVYVRGQDTSNPVILFIHGGPASPMSPVMWMFQRPIEEYFTVVNYDQRASGKTYASNDTTSLGNTIHIDEYVNDAVELAAFIEKNIIKEK